MQIKTLPVGHLETNCYIVSNENTHECVVIDPGDESNCILDYIEDCHLKCTAILLTHGHYDHTGAVETVAEETGAVVYMNSLDDCKNYPYSDVFIYSLPENGISCEEGDVIEQAGLAFEVIATPGHTKGSVTFKVEDALFTGDTLFRGSCGRTDSPGGSWEQLTQSLRRLGELEGDYLVCPGHGDSTTLQRERRGNVFMMRAMVKE